VVLHGKARQGKVSKAGVRANGTKKTPKVSSGSDEERRSTSDSTERIGGERERENM